MPNPAVSAKVNEVGFSQHPVKCHYIFAFHNFSGVGGIPYGDENDEITLTTCEPVADASEIDPDTLVPVKWGSQYTLNLAYEVLIGKKTDPYCFTTFPGADSVSSIIVNGPHD